MKSLISSFFPYIINSRFSLNMEHGITNKWYNCMRANMKMGYERYAESFDSLKDYINESMRFDNLELKNFKTIFSCYFSLLLFNLILFIIAYLSNRNIFNCLVVLSKIH